MNDDELSRVVFLNEVENGARREEVRDAMAERFNLGTKVLARLFAGRRIETVVIPMSKIHDGGLGDRRGVHDMTVSRARHRFVRGV